MGLFWKKSTGLPITDSEQSHDIRVEVVVSKEANKEVARQAKEANKTLNTLLATNHFTIKIYRATRNTPTKKGLSS